LDDVRRHPMSDRIGDEPSAEVVEGVYHSGRLPASLAPTAVSAWSRNWRSALSDTTRFLSRRCHRNDSGVGGLQTRSFLS
jgi:hypothetical protein